MKSFNHNGYKIELTSKKTTSGLWRSTAGIKYGSDWISIEVRQYGRDGYDSETDAEEKTIAEAKLWIDRKTTFKS